MTVSIREFRYGDMGPIVVAQADFYARAFGWRGDMERLLLEVAHDFLRDHIPGRSNCWIAEVDGVAAGSVFCVDDGNGVARLRLLYLDERARGHGLGVQLVGHCIEFARAAGYHRMTLWTHAVLVSARRLYAGAGFCITATATHDDFGVAVAGETWELAL